MMTDAFSSSWPSGLPVLPQDHLDSAAPRAGWADVNLRPELAAHLCHRLESFEEGFLRNLALLGPPGSGKTFQLQQLVSRCQSNVTRIYCQLYRESCRGFFHRFLCAILQAGLPSEVFERASGSQALHAGGRLNDDVLERLMEAAEPQLPNTVAAIRQVSQLVCRRLYGEAFNRSLDTIPILIQERQRPCVLILDEFLYLEELGLGHAFHELGKRVMTWRSALFVLSSSSPYRARTILRERLQLLFGQFELVTLDGVEREPLAHWVREALQAVPGASAISAFLVWWLDAYPWYLSVFLKRFRELVALNRHAVESEALFLQTAWDVLGSEEGPLHQWCVSRLERLVHGRLGARALEVLSGIAGGARTTTEIGKRVGRAGLSEALQRLVEQDLSQRNGTCWIIIDPILRCWMSTVFVEQRTVDRFDSAGVRRSFECYLRSLWAHWIQTRHLSFAEQVVGLFGKFRDDTVTLDSKTGRLPRFEMIRTHLLASDGRQTCLIADAQGKRWCATIQSGPVDENAIADFEAFCRQQIPKPSRKIVVLNAGMERNARLLAKAANMWVWEPSDFRVLMELYGRSDGALRDHRQEAP